MFITPHMLVGAAIGSRVSSAWAAFVFGFLSHFVLDFIPHWDYVHKVIIKRRSHQIKLALDTIIGIGLVLFFSWSHPLKFSIWVAVIASILPDVLQFFWYGLKMRWLELFGLFHHRVHVWQGISFWQGILSVIIVCLAAFYVLLL